MRLPGIKRGDSSTCRGPESKSPCEQVVRMDFVRSKQSIRRSVWDAMDREGVSRFPGAHERIPNFANARAAAERLAKHSAWTRAKTIKANPDAPQTHSRRLALEQGKTLVMAVPRLRDAHPFRLLDPSKLSAKKLREAATIKGAL